MDGANYSLGHTHTGTEYCEGNLGCNPLILLPSGVIQPFAKWITGSKLDCQPAASLPERPSKSLLHKLSR